MYIDKQTMLSSGQTVTTAAGSTDYYDQGAAGDTGLYGKGLQMMIKVDEAVTAAGAATVTFQLQCDADPAFGSPKTVISSDAIGKADLVIGKQVFLPLPIGLDERYVRVYYSIGTGPLTAGKFTAAIVEGVQANKAYPDAI